MLTFLLLVALKVHAPPKHGLTGQSSYYAKCLEGTITATGEVFHHRLLTAAHRTLPLGTEVEVTSRATGKKVKLLINDRGPFVRKFVIDLSSAANAALGLKNSIEDRYVTIRVLRLPKRPRAFPARKLTTKLIRGSCKPRILKIAENHIRMR